MISVTIVSENEMRVSIQCEENWKIYVTLISIFGLENALDAFSKFTGQRVIVSQRIYEFVKSKHIIDVEISENIERVVPSNRCISAYISGKRDLYLYLTFTFDDEIFSVVLNKKIYLANKIERSFIEFQNERRNKFLFSELFWKQFDSKWRFTEKYFPGQKKYFELIEQ